MDVVITRRHTDPHPSLQLYIERRVERLERFYSRLHGAAVILDDADGRHSVEMTVSADRGPRFAAHAEADTWHESVNLAEARLESQLRKYKERTLDRRLLA